MGLSVTILTCNEERDLPRCLASVAELADQLLVIDSGSTDATLELARKAGAEIVEHPWTGFVGQRQIALDHATQDWVLCLDADEWLDGELAAALARVLAGADQGHAGFELNRRSRYLGGWIDHCGWSPEWRLRLLRRGAGRSGGVEPHDHMEVTGSTGRLAGRLLHEPYVDLAEHLSKINAYTTTIAERRVAAGKRVGFGKLLLGPPFRFARMYLLQRGVLDGWRGLVVCALGSWYAFLKDAKTREAHARN